MRLRLGETGQIDQLWRQLDELIERDWRGKPAEDLAQQLRRLRARITAATAVYQARMRELQRTRARERAS